MLFYLILFLENKKFILKMESKKKALKIDTGVLSENEYKILMFDFKNPVEKMLIDEHMYKLTEIIRERSSFNIQSTLLIQTPDLIVPVST